MPYIKADERHYWNKVVAWHAFSDGKATPGDLNYVITKIISEWWKQNPRYSRVAEITGVLENVKQEFYRRIAVPYENAKIVENGDVY